MIKFNLDNKEKFNSFCNLMENNIDIIARAITNRINCSRILFQTIVNDKSLSIKEKEEVFKYAQSKNISLSIRQLKETKNWRKKYKSYAQKYAITKAKNL